MSLLGLALKLPPRFARVEPARSELGFKAVCGIDWTVSVSTVICLDPSAVLRVFAGANEEVDGFLEGGPDGGTGLLSVEAFCSFDGGFEVSFP